MSLPSKENTCLPSNATLFSIYGNQDLVAPSVTSIYKCHVCHLMAIMCNFSLQMSYGTQWPPSTIFMYEFQFHLWPPSAIFIYKFQLHLVVIRCTFSLQTLFKNMWLYHYANHSFCNGTTIMGFQQAQWFKVMVGPEQDKETTKYVTRWFGSSLFLGVF